jgi:hypothetical protein
MGLAFLPAPFFSYLGIYLHSQPQSSGKQQPAKYLQFTYFGGDAGRTFDIFINNKKIAAVVLDGSRGAEFYTVDYPVPEALVKNAPGGVLVVKFVAGEGSIAGGIYGVRLLK